MKKESDRQEKRAITVAIIVIVILLGIVLKASSQEVRYLVCIDDGDSRNIEQVVFKSVDNMAAYYFEYTGHILDTGKLFLGTRVYFEYRNQYRIFYCEKKKVHLKWNGKRVLRKIKKKEIHLYNKQK